MRERVDEREKENVKSLRRCFSETSIGNGKKCNRWIVFVLDKHVDGHDF